MRSDVYALGVILYELLTDTFPYDVDGNLIEIVSHIVSAEPRSGEPFTATLGGIAAFDEAFLDAAQTGIAGGVETVNLVELNATVHVRSGTTGDDDVVIAMRDKVARDLKKGLSARKKALAEAKKELEREAARLEAMHGLGVRKVITNSD